MRRLGTRQLSIRDWPSATRYFARSLAAQPGNARSAILLACSILRWIPAPVRRRTGL